MPTIETLRNHADRMGLQEGTDWSVQTYTVRTTGEKISVLELTDAGLERRSQLSYELFENASLAHFEIPLGRDVTPGILETGDVLTMNGLLAISIIRRRSGGFVCTFTDDFSRLSEEKYHASVRNVNKEEKTVRLLFDHWPGEFIRRDFVLEKPHLVSLGAPLSIGPESVVDFRVLSTGRPHEDPILWLKNLVKRNATLLRG